jgi:hypothetical protein
MRFFKDKTNIDTLLSGKCLEDFKNYINRNKISIKTTTNKDSSVLVFQGLIKDFLEEKEIIISDWGSCNIDGKGRVFDASVAFRKKRLNENDPNIDFERETRIECLKALILYTNDFYNKNKYLWDK